MVAEDDAMTGLLRADVLDGMGHACTITAALAWSRSPSEDAITTVAT